MKNAVCGTYIENGIVWVVIDDEGRMFGPYTSKETAERNCAAYVGESVRPVLNHGLLPVIA